MKCREHCLQTHPHCQNQWVGIPELSGATEANPFKVCHTDAENWCGASCTWTVPSDAALIRFQLWGAGGGSGAPHAVDMFLMVQLVHMHQ